MDTKDTTRDTVPMAAYQPQTLDLGRRGRVAVVPLVCDSGEMPARDDSVTWPEGAVPVVGIALFEAGGLLPVVRAVVQGKLQWLVLAKEIPIQVTREAGARAHDMLATTALECSPLQQWDASKRDVYMVEYNRNRSVIGNCLVANAMTDSKAPLPRFSFASVSSVVFWVLLRMQGIESMEQAPQGAAVVQAAMDQWDVYFEPHGVWYAQFKQQRKHVDKVNLCVAEHMPIKFAMAAIRGRNAASASAGTFGQGRLPEFPRDNLTTGYTARQYQLLQQARIAIDQAVMRTVFRDADAAAMLQFATLDFDSLRTLLNGKKALPECVQTAVDSLQRLAAELPMIANMFDSSWLKFIRSENPSVLYEETGLQLILRLLGGKAEDDRVNSVCIACIDNLGNSLRENVHSVLPAVLEDQSPRQQLLSCLRQICQWMDFDELPASRNHSYAADVYHGDFDSQQGDNDDDEHDPASIARFSTVGTVPLTTAVPPPSRRGNTSRAVGPKPEPEFEAFVGTLAAAGLLRN
jgi:hypothetical protein